MTDIPVTNEARLGEEDLPELYRSGRAKQARARRNRILSYAAGVLVLAYVIYVGDWEKIQRLYFDPEKAKTLFPDIITIAAKNTVIYTVGAFIGGVAIGLLMAVMKMSSLRPYRWFAVTYIEIFRGLPALLTIFLVGFATPTVLGIQFPEILGVPTAGIISLALVAGAYLAETIRAGIQGVPKGQVEAARSLGMTPNQTLRIVVVPQAFRLVIPPLTNEMVLLLKDTALLASLGTTTATVELTKYGKDAFSKDFNGTPFIVAGVIYLMLTIPLTYLVGRLEKRNELTR
ncbi:MAG TPA: amino acid ABC transporter permease [Acidimicrobiales bacterium]|jgi:polar amino acid transport system permease protein|nr:amino acid ABC transporter permease [Acidimicrobiales bacterium]